MWRFTYDDRGDIRQAIDRCSNIWASLPGAGYGCSEQALTALLAKFSRLSEWSERLMASESPRLSPLLVICINVRLSWAVNHYRDNAIAYKAQRDKNARELKLANAAITDMQMRQRDVAALDAKYTKELADAKAENDALRDDVAAGRRRLHIKAVCQSVREATTARRIMQPPRLADTAERDYFTFRERLTTMQKQLEGTQKYINEQCR